MEFYNEHPDDDRFEIIAFHDAQAKTFEEMDAKCADAKAKYWGGKDLPFPVVLDATGETIERFEINAFPTLILFDPEGRLVGRARLETLKDALEGKVKTPEPLKLKESVALPAETGEGG